MKRTVREYKDADLNAMLDVWERSSRLAHPFLTDAFIAQERENIPKIYMPLAETWIMEQDGTVIGFIALIGHELGAIFVQPESHGTGAGRALMDKAVELRGDLEVEVFTENAIGRRFYDKYGFELVTEKVHEATGNALMRLKYTPTP